MKTETEQILQQAEKIKQMRLEIEAGRKEFINRLSVDIPDIHEEDYDPESGKFACNENEYN